MECKVNDVAEVMATVNRINRNIVECKADILCPESTDFSVLIETLWNVKDVEAVGVYAIHNSINRNIVECKGVILPDSISKYKSINRNIVECKVL